jgi:hypothetical protein
VRGRHLQGLSTTTTTQAPVTTTEAPVTTTTEPTGITTTTIYGGSPVCPTGAALVYPRTGNPAPVNRSSTRGSAISTTGAGCPAEYEG